MQEPQPVRERPPPWTLAEGLRTTQSILLRRAPTAIAAWGILLIVWGASVRSQRETEARNPLDAPQVTESPARDLPRALPMKREIGVWMFTAAFAGWILVRRLVDRVGFTGLHLRSLAVGVAVASIGLATLIALPFLPPGAGSAVAVRSGLGAAVAAILAWMLTADD